MKRLAIRNQIKIIKELKMKRKRIRKTIVLVFFLISAHSGLSQGFVNLDFESAKIIPIAGSPYSITVSNAFPGWFLNGSMEGQTTYNDPSLGSTGVSLWATNGAQISGNFSALLQAGQASFPATISQTGLVPASVQSLLFQAQPGRGSLEVYLGGQSLSFSALSDGPNYTLYGADISSFAGQAKELMFSALRVSTGLNNWTLDNIQFSPSAVPEPSTIALTTLGTVLLGFHRWRKLARRT